MSGRDEGLVSPASAQVERFVPSGEPSLLDDAPGWNVVAQRTKDEAGELQLDAGPICWKCRGTGTKPVTSAKVKKDGQTRVDDNQDESEPGSLSLLNIPPCSVCQGLGRLAPKRADVEGISKPGVITRGRKRPLNWAPSGPAPVALMNRSIWTDMVDQANREQVDVVVADAPPDNRHEQWLPRAGEELCNLVGSWRILQRVGSHRWTTDDLCTAYVATLQLDDFANALPQYPSSSTSTRALQYLDLGTGNASVLQMASWAILRDGRFSLSATGVEARTEAAELARRSISFNLGNDGRMDHSVAFCRVVHGDFRDQAFDEPFDLVTGTPPYFRVDFVVDANERVVTSAIINQGGMPTAKQSAPARCEFRGGIEAYCETAARLMNHDHGKFVVCENWLNHNRVVQAAEQVGLQIIYQLQVEGREGRGTLFCVYVMIHTKSVDTPCEVKALAVRDGNGEWTEAYKCLVLETMSIPTP